MLGVIPAAWAQSADTDAAGLLPGPPVPDAWVALTTSLAPSIALSHHQLDTADDRLTATSVRFSAADASASPGALTVGRLELHGTPDPSNPDAIGRLVMHDVLYRPGGSGVGRIDRLTIEGAQGLGGFLQALVTLPDDDADPDGENPGDAPEAAEAETEAAQPAVPAATIETLLTVLQALEMESITAEGVTTIERRGGTRQQTLSLDRLTVGPVGGGVVQALALETLAITERSRVDIDRIDVRAMDIGHWLTLAADTEVELVPLALIVEPGLESVSITGFDMTSEDGSPLLALAGGRFEIPADDTQGAGTSVVVDGLAFPVSTLDDAVAEAALRDLGYADLEASIEVALQLDRTGETLALSPFRLALVDMATVEVAFSLGRFDLETLIGQVQTMARTGIPQLPPTTLDSASITMTDASLTGRLIQRAASVQGRTAEQVIDDVTGQVSALADAWQLEDPHRTDLLDAIEGFLTAPGTMTIEAAPDRPVTLLEAGLGAVAGPGTLFERLNVAITTQ